MLRWLLIRLGSLYLYSWWFRGFIVLVFVVVSGFVVPAFVVVCWSIVPSFRVVLSEVRYVSLRSPRVTLGCRGTPWAILCPSSFSSLSLFLLRGWLVVLSPRPGPGAHAWFFSLRARARVRVACASPAVCLLSLVSFLVRVVFW